jgi:hypothetical protein
MRTAIGDMASATWRNGSVGALPDLEITLLHGRYGPATGALGELLRTISQRVRDSAEAWAHPMTCALARDVLVAGSGIVRWWKQ